MSTHDRAGNAYGSPAKSATNAQRMGQYSSDASGGGTVNRFSAATRKAPKLSKEEYHTDLKAGRIPDSARGSQTQYKVSNAPTASKGQTMQETASNYRAARKSGMSPDDARGQALSKAGSNAKMTQDAHGNKVR